MSIRDDLATIIRRSPNGWRLDDKALADEILGRFAVLEYRDPDRISEKQNGDTMVVWRTNPNEWPVVADGPVVHAGKVYANVRHGDDPSGYCAAIMSAHRHALTHRNRT